MYKRHEFHVQHDVHRRRGGEKDQLGGRIGGRYREPVGSCCRATASIASRISMHKTMFLVIFLCNSSNLPPNATETVLDDPFP